MFGMPLSIGYLWLQFGHIIVPSSIWICIQRKSFNETTRKIWTTIHTSSKTWCKFCKNSSSTISGISLGRDVSPNYIILSKISHVMNQRAIPRTSFAASTNAFHSTFGRNPLTKSALNSASRTSTVTSCSFRGKLFVLQPLAWHASKLCVISRTIAKMIEN